MEVFTAQRGNRLDDTNLSIVSVGFGGLQNLNDLAQDLEIDS
jgi:hypothetical protein